MKKNGNKWIAVILVLASLIMSRQTLLAAPYDFLVNQISGADYESYVEDLVGFGTRYYNTAGNTSAASYIYNQFSNFGLNVAYDPFYYNLTYYNNVVATLPGSAGNDEIYIIGAHFDSTSGIPSTNAPGADDNASGVAAVLEIASVLSQYTSDATIKFIAFNAEEEGLRGSRAYALEARAYGDDIKAMINFDMIAYTGGNPLEDVEVMGDNWLVDHLMANASLYAPSLLKEKHYGNVYGSDHYYFHSSLFPGSSSAFFIEDTADEIRGGSNPYYHTTDDLPEYLDYGFALDITRAGAGALSELAGITVPIPSALWLLLSGLIGLAGRRKKMGRAVYA